MPRATITFDPQRLLPADASTCRVESAADYVPTCAAIHHALHTAGETLSVFVYDKIVAGWLRAFASQYGSDHIDVRQYTEQQALTDRWKVQVPTGVLPQDIIRAGLLDVDVTPRAGQTFEDVLLEVFYGDFFGYATFPAERLADFLNKFDSDRWKANEEKPIVARTMRERLAHWEGRESNEARRWVIGRLRSNPAKLRHKLATYQLLHTYGDEPVEKVLGENAGRIRQARLDLDALALADLDLSEATTEIEYSLTATQVKVTSAEDLVALLDLLSGHLTVEFDTVEALAQQHVEWMDRSLVRRIEQRFAPIREGIASRLARLSRLISPPYPTEPDAAWPVEKWLTWVRDSYMPYHRWQEDQHHFDVKVAGYAATFADWYFDNFIALKNGAPQHFTFSSLYLDREHFVTGDAVTLVILLDNFNYAHIAELRQAFNQVGFSMLDERPTLALIPTATEVGKAALIMTTGDQADILTSDYTSQVLGAWNPVLKSAGKSAAYLPNLGELQQLKALQHDFYVLNYLPIDKALHENAQETGQDHASIVAQHLQQLARLLVEFSRRFQLDKRLIIYIVSDHGSTRIGRGVVNVLDQRFYGNIAANKHHRYLALSDDQFSKLPQMVEAQCYVIDRQRFKTNQHYLAARNYYRFVDTNEDFFVHGGLTPEEVVVPFIRFEMRPVEALPPTVRLLLRPFRFAVKSIVELELGNPNSVSLENVRLKLLGQSADEIIVDTLSPKQSSSVQFTTVFKKEPGAGVTRDLKVRIQYECQGRKFEPVDVPFTITLRALMEESNDFDF
jgi:hypothetical protein